MDNKPSPQLKEEKKVGIGAYIALIFAIVIFSGVFYQMPEARKWLSAFDFTTLIGKFGVIGDSKSNYIGSGGWSARAAFLFALSLIPSVMLAMGLIEVLAHYGALRAAQVLMTPLLKRSTQQKRTGDHVRMAVRRSRMRQQLLRHCFRTVFPIRVSGVDSDAHHFCFEVRGRHFYPLCSEHRLQEGFRK